MPMIERVRQLGQRWTAAREAANRREALTKDAQRVALELGERQSRLAELAKRRAAMLAKVNVASDGQFLELTKQAARRDQLQEEIRKEERALSVAREGTEIAVAVSDTGPGLKAEDLGKIFQPFQPLSAVPTGGESSTGLGLHIAREIAALHGGRLGVDSVPGAGATFTLSVPTAGA